MFHLHAYICQEYLKYFFSSHVETLQIIVKITDKEIHIPTEKEIINA